MNVSSTPYNLSIPPQGMSTAIMNITADQNAQPRPYTALINATISFPTIVRNYLTEQSFQNPTSAQIVKSYDVAFTVLEKLGLQQQMINFIDSWFTPIAGVIVTVITIITGVLGWRIWNKKRRTDQANR